MEMSPPAAMASMKALVPDLAMVPKLLMSSFLVMPMPESSMVKVEFVLSGTILGARKSFLCSEIDFPTIICLGKWLDEEIRLGL